MHADILRGPWEGIDVREPGGAAKGVSQLVRLIKHYLSPIASHRNIGRWMEAAHQIIKYSYSYSDHLSLLVSRRPYARHQHRPIYPTGRADTSM